MPKMQVQYKGRDKGKGEGRPKIQATENRSYEKISDNKA